MLPERPPYLEVALPLDLGDPLTYRLPRGMDARLGARVHVPLGGRGEVGFVVGVTAEPPPGLEPAKVKAVRGVIDRRPLIDAERLELGRWLAEYYQAPLGAALDAMLPVSSRTRRMYGWGPAGRPLELVGPALELWDRLGDGPLNRRALLDGLPKEAAAELDRLVETGHLRSWDEPLAPKLKTRERLAVRLTDGLPDLDELADKAPAQARLLAALEAHGAPGEYVWAADACRWADTGHSTLHALERRGWVESARLERLGVDEGDDAGHDLNNEQARAVGRVCSALGSWSAFLLRGVTGSGKTEVYLRCVAAALERGRGAIVLVPEIALTAQLARQFGARFGDAVALLHSRQGPARRRGEWLRLYEGRARVALGPRSAVFAPIKDLGLVVIDEEHEDAYKQAEVPRYHAREVAARRCRLNDCPLLLGSATPSIWSAHLAREGRLETLELTERVDGAAPPAVQLVDLRGREAETLVPPELSTALGEAVKRGRQGIVLLNRRGYAAGLQCERCGFIPVCGQCNVPLVLHRTGNELRCHHCDAVEPLPPRCPSCGGTGTLAPLGVGTERIEQELNRLLPLVRVVRLDSDTARGSGGHEGVLARFAAGQADVLLGTQMVAKGFHFPRVTVVGVLRADAGLALPDYRAAERTFNLLTQVIGRAGRGLWPGRAIIAAHQAEHYAVDCAARGRYAEYLEAELDFRRRALLPPYVRLASLVVSAEAAPQAHGAAVDLADELGGLLAEHYDRRRYRLLGPAPAPLERVRGRWRFQLLLKASSGEILKRVLKTARDSARGWSKPHLAVDVDPVSLM